MISAQRTKSTVPESTLEANEKDQRKPPKPWYRRNPLKKRVPPPVPESRSLSKEKSSNFLSQLTFYWINGLMTVCISQPCYAIFLFGFSKILGLFPRERESNSCEGTALLICETISRPATIAHSNLMTYLSYHLNDVSMLQLTESKKSSKKGWLAAIDIPYYSLSIMSFSEPSGRRVLVGWGQMCCLPFRLKCYDI